MGRLNIRRHCLLYVADLGGRLVYVDEVGVGVHPMNAPAAETP